MISLFEAMFGPRNTGLDALFDRPKPSIWQSFVASPLKYLAKNLYLYQNRQRRTCRPPEKAVKIVCISDTHNTQPPIPHGDLLVHAGDLTQSGSPEEIQAGLTWLQSLSHPHKIVIAGNHDIGFDTDDISDFQWGDVKYLQDSETSISFSNGRRLNVFGSPWTPTPGTWAFQHSHNKDVWTGRIPVNTDLLVTHMPPRFHLDIAGFGDDNLLKELWRVRPKLHVFGHVHGGWGKDCLIYDQFELWYEEICRGSGGLFALLTMLFRCLSFVWQARDTRGTILVNAAAVGGLRETERRSPTVVLL